MKSSEMTLCHQVHSSQYFEESLSPHIFPQCDPTDEGTTTLCIVSNYPSSDTASHTRTLDSSANTADMTSKLEQLCGRQVTLNLKHQVATLPKNIQECLV